MSIISTTCFDIDISSSSSSSGYCEEVSTTKYRGADKSLVRPRRNQARKHVRDAGEFNKIETRDVIKFLFLQGKAPKEIHDILTETLAFFLPGRAKNLSAPLYFVEATERLTSNCVSKVTDKLLLSTVL